MYKIYVTEQQKNDATTHYIEIIRKSLVQRNEDVCVINNINDINNNDIVVVIEAKTHIRVLLKNPKQKVICWYQGILPEEINLQRTRNDKYLRMAFWYLMECLSLRFSHFCLFVSEEMRKHFERKYRLQIRNYYVMPCFNQPLLKESFFVTGKYNSPTFVYAGSMHKWQCIDKMLEIFKSIKKEIPAASLTIYTSEQKLAREYIEKHSVKNVKIDYLPYKELNIALQNYKYGFLIRDNIEVNSVATPTKMNTYLANGIIPIYNNSMTAFRENLRNIKHQIIVDGNGKFIDKLKELENSNVIPEDIYSEYKNELFSKFYSDEFHISQLSRLL